MKKFIKALYSTKSILLFTFLINILIFGVSVWYLGTAFYASLTALGMIIALILVSRSEDSSAYKVTWVITILLVPVFGVALYLYLKERRGTKKQRKNWQMTTFQNNSILEEDAQVLSNLQKHNPYAYNMSRYLFTATNMPVYQNTSVEYLATGEAYFQKMFEELRKAKHFILLEFFIVKPGVIWNELFEILKLKVREGVEVKFLYDDFGCLDRFPDKLTFLKLNNHGIQCMPFNKIKPHLSLFCNYRDHRKIVVIDNHVAFTGGVNVADEYANINSPFGMWKDTGIMVKGDAAWNYTVMALNQWQLATNENIQFDKYHITYTKPEKTDKSLKGYVQPYGDGPINPEPALRNAYVKMLNFAQHDIIITTPYFILDESTKEAIKLCAKSGVKVKIIMPGIPDKKWIFYLSRSYYWELIKAGVEIYEYEPGFVHAKMITIDDSSAIVGTVNWDFRSLYLHYENAVFMHNCQAISSMNKDLNAMLTDCKLITLRDIKARKWYEKTIAFILKIFAPLL